MLTTNTGSIPIYPSDMGKKEFVMNNVEAGRAAARHIWSHWSKPTYQKPEDPMTPEFADGALLEYAQLQEDAPGVLHVMADGAQKGAQQLNLDDYHGVMEVLQNADDLFATEVVATIRTAPEGNELFIVHNGEPVAVQHVLAMTYAFISTKVDDPRQKGKFGVGLKTLGRIADRMEVHSNTYSFAIENQRIKKIPPCAPIGDMYQPGERSTLLRLRLFNTFDVQEFLDWFSSLDASILLFLDTVTSFRFLQDGDIPPLEHILDKDPVVKTWNVHKGRQQLEITSCTCKDRATGKGWTRFQVEIEVPKKVVRSHKKTDEKTRLGLALPEEHEQQHIYAGLPTYINTTLPFSLDAQFDPDTSRESLLHTTWNKWLINEIAEFFAAVTTTLFAENPARAWELIPLAAEMSFEDSFLKNNFQEALQLALDRVKLEALVKAEDCNDTFTNLVFEATALEGLLDVADYPLLSEDKKGLPISARDKEGRWRKILQELGWCREIGVADAFHLFKDDIVCTRKDPRWFVDVLLAALTTSTIDPIFSFPCILLENGSRVPAQHPGRKTVMLVRYDRHRSLSHFKLSHTLHPVYFNDHVQWSRLDKFFLEQTNYSEDAKPHDLLTSFVNRNENSAVELSDNELADIKTLYDACGYSAQDLGERLGKSILLDAHRWERGKKVNCKTRISDCYLPSGIVKDKAGQWFAAAGKTPGLIWISSRYRLLLRGFKKNIDNLSDESILKTPGAGMFLRKLGAEIAPRITKLSTRRDLPSPLPKLQRAAIGKLRPAPTHLENDYISQDLEAVVENICKVRNKERKERGVALFEAIAFSWERAYAGVDECLTTYYYYNWKHPGRIPSTWISRLAGSDWLMNLKNVPKAPMDLVIRTSATRSIYGEAPHIFAAGLEESHCETGFPPAMWMETNPKASGIIEQIQRMRDGEDDFNYSRLQQLYMALAEIAKRVKSPNVLSSIFDDINVAALRSRFGQGGVKGLLFVDGIWAVPEKVYWGRNIFHGLRLFAPSGKRFEPLWRSLGLHQPGFDDCLTVLREIAKRPLDTRSEEVLIDTYRQINSLLGSLTTADKRRLGEMPLWCHGTWVKKRPVFLVNSEEVANNMAEKIPMWNPPCSFASMAKLLAALKVIVIDTREFTLQGVTTLGEMAGEQERPRFMRTVSAMEEYFARTDDQLYRSIQGDWDTLRQAPIYICEHLAIGWVFPGLPKITSDIRAHVTTNPLAFYFRTVDDIGEKNAGGKVVAEYFQPETCREQVALAWVWKWQEAVKTQGHDLSLAKEPEKEATDEVHEAAKKSKGKESRYERGNPGGKTTKQDQPLKVERKLKDFALLGTASISSVNSGAQPGGYKEPASRGLKKDPPHAPKVGTPSPGTPSGAQSVIAYTTEDLEEKALRCLDHVLKHGKLGELKDFHKFRGIGADAAIDLKKFFEIKASAREMPDRVELTLNELDRAKLSSDSFYLVVVSGLEEGYETILHIYKNPLRTLDWSPSRSLVVSGLKAKQAVQVRLNVDIVT